ncbi:hypothetical protein [Paraburkholderia aromaticivorans]|uniref:hypothetical protein n=1 Tax=Paraburkholderia aromaticivorans TaxID=2026199 RepID=UPI0014560D9A|nr:hypothetical protein [Paraburkholderia aromaticivorans]
MTLFGTDGAPEPPGPARGVCGISLAWSCQAGIGLYRDYPMETDAEDRMHASDAFAASDRRPEQRQTRLAIHRAEIEMLNTVARRAADAQRVALRVIEQAEGSWIYGFDVAYRRRLAYALAFEASIEQRSLEPYIRWWLPLISLNARDFATVAPDAAAPHAFSVLLNLAAMLNRADAFERANGCSHPALPGRIAEVEAKRALLRERLETAAAARMKTLSSDGQIALRALFIELAFQRKVGTLHVTTFPRWGRIVTSEHYGAPDDLPLTS